ncbi:MAG: HAD-IB family hydrolase [Salinisphaera sp.]|nr:HAD-IB family hydrolase [Salinisphaera sp.]MDN5938339.1 HAD-IB family hydrolase [Salinisphaera sp.]
MSRLVLFDIDGTLVPRPGTEPRFVRYLLRRGRLGPRQMLASLWFLLRWFPVYGRRVLQKNKAWLSGLEPAVVNRWAREFVFFVLLDCVHPPALRRLKEHVAAGDHVVLLSGTPEFLACALAQAVGAQGAYGSLCMLRAGRYCAGLPPRHPHGASKVDAARELAASTGLPLDEAIAYGDSINDTHLFRVVGRSVTVMPDKELRDTAGGEGWETLAGPH